MNIDILEMKRLPSNEMVIVVDWIASKTSGDATVSERMSTELPPSDPSSEDFVPFNDLTKDQVQQWVLNQVDAVAVEAKLDQRMHEKLNPAQISGLPAGFFPPEDES